MYAGTLSFKGSKLAAPGVTNKLRRLRHYTAEQRYARLYYSEHIHNTYAWFPYATSQS